MPKLSENECATFRKMYADPRSTPNIHRIYDLLDTIDALRGGLAEAKAALGTMCEQRRQSEEGYILQAENLIRELREAEAKLAPNPKCGHPMACWVKQDSPLSYPDINLARGYELIDTVRRSGHCTICAEKEAAVRVARLEGQLVAINSAADLLDDDYVEQSRKSIGERLAALLPKGDQK